MYTGTLIDELMAAVERAEQHAKLALRPNLREDLRFAPVPAVYQAAQTENNLLGAA